MTTKKTSKKGPLERSPRLERKPQTPKRVTDHGVDHGHDSRVDDQSEYDATHTEENPMSWLRPSNLEAPPPQAGKTQRWIRQSVRGEADPKNLNRTWREGWRPRDPATLPEEWRIYANFADQNNGMIVVDDLILMEIDSTILEARREAVREATQAQMASVEHDLERAQVSGHPISREHKSTVSHPPRPRVVEVAPDD